MSVPKLSALIGLIALASLALLLWRSERSPSSSERDPSGVVELSSAAPRLDRIQEGEAGARGSSDRQAPEPAERAELASLTGTLKIAGEDLPLPGIRVVLGGGSAIETNATGGFAFSGLAPGTVQVAVEAGAPFEPLERALELAPGRNELELLLEARFELSVAVVARSMQPQDDGRPLAGARVWLERAALLQSEPEAPLSSSATDSQGHCVLTGIPSGDLALVAEADGFVPSRLALALRVLDLEPAARRRSIAVSLSTTTGVLRGRVTGPDRAPQAGAFVCLQESRNASAFGRNVAAVQAPSAPFALCDASGAFELPLPEGAADVALIVCSRDPAVSPITRQRVPPEHFEREVVVRLERARRVELRVIGPDHQGVPGRLRVSDGALELDRVSDPVLSAIPGFAAEFGGSLDLERGSSALSLPDGGYSIRFDGGPGVLGAWFITVDSETPDVIELRLPE